MTVYTPLRYPGGKAKLYDYVSELIANNCINPPAYIEPFVGGAGLALKLLMTNKVSEIYINDYDPAIWALWESILNHSKEIIMKIEEVELSVIEWKNQKQIYLEQNLSDIVSVGFATLYLNRTNRSGIIKANPIGGLSQDGDYKIDCRFNREALINQISIINQERERIHLSCEDAKVFIERIDREVQNAFFYLDPPYVKKGYQLYNNSFVESDHVLLRDAITNLRNPWFVTYDDCSLIEDLYADFEQRKFDLSYSIETKTIGTEIAIYSDALNIIPKFK